MTATKNYNYIINYQVSIYDILNSNQTIISNSSVNSSSLFYIQSFRLINNLFLPNSSNFIISLIFNTKTTIYNESIAEGGIIRTFKFEMQLAHFPAFVCF
jgi:hypothetical protein